MCTTVGLTLSAIPKQLLAEHDLWSRVHDRGGNHTEVWFAFNDPEPLLPVIDGGKLAFHRWGSRDRAGALPVTGWTWRESVRNGAWAGLGCPVEPVIIPATYGCEKGVWFRITEGIHGLIARPPEGPPSVYMICEEPTRYFRVMTRGERMPWMVDEVI